MKLRCSLFTTVLLGVALVNPAAAGAADFPKIYNSHEVGPTPLLPADEAVKGIHLPPGFQATVFAAEPDVQQPIAMTTDARGRLWVAENYTYSEQKLNFDLKLHDRIVILEDTTHSGHFDRRTVFWDQAQKLTSVAVGFGGVYVLCPPRLLFLPDRNHDDIPDGEPEVLLDGFDDGAVRHNIANGLKWGPDGWLYGRHGILASSNVGHPGDPEDRRTRVNAGIWRFHPVTRRFEVVAAGTTNPWGSDWDDLGQMFFINTVIGHLWQVIPGAYYRRMYGEHPNPHLYELIDQTADHLHWNTAETWDQIRKLGVTGPTSLAGGGHAHSGLMMYLGDNWPDQYRNTMFTANFHGRRINNDRLERAGASYTARHAPDFMSIDDPWFRGLELLSGSDGSVFVSDWSDFGECHNQEGIHRTSGRIYRLAYGTPKAWTGDISALPDAELVRLQLEKNDWFVRQARQTLQERAAQGKDRAAVHVALHAQFRDQAEVSRKLRALWALYVTGGVTEAWLRELLHAPDEAIRVWAIQLATDQGAPSQAMQSEFSTLARQDPSGLVLTFLASALRRFPLEQRWELARGLAERAEFANDRVFPLMLWYGIEPAVPGFSKEAVALALDSRIPKLRRFLARRIGEELVPNPTAANELVGLLTATSNTRFRLDVLGGLSEALNGVKHAVAPVAWPAVVAKLATDPEPRVSTLTRELSAVFGDAGALTKLRATLVDRSAGVGDRRQALRTLLQNPDPGLPALLAGLLDDADLALDALRGLAALGDTNTPALLLQHYADLKTDAARAEAINTLISRPAFATATLTAVQRGRLPRPAIGPTQIRQLLSFSDAGIIEQVHRLWPRLDDSAGGRRELLVKYQGLLTPARLQAASPAAGRKVFQQTCAVCHSLYGEGAKIGPDLTGSDRHNLEYLLDNILDPSAVVPESYRVSTVTLKDERVINGIVLSQTDQVLKVQSISEQLVVPRAEIATIAESRLSLMPDGLLEALPEPSVCDLIAYLMTDSPLSPPAVLPAK